MGGAQHQLRGVFGAGHLDQGGGHVGGHDLDEPTAEIVQQGTIVDQALRTGSGQGVVGPDVHPDQLGFGPHGHPGGPPDEDGTAA